MPNHDKGRKPITAIRVCPISKDGRHFGYRDGYMMLCRYCPAQQVYTDNPGNGWMVQGK